MRTCEGNGLERLVRALYHRGLKPEDYFDLHDSKTLNDAADVVGRFNMEVHRAAEYFEAIHPPKGSMLEKALYRVCNLHSLVRGQSVSAKSAISSIEKALKSAPEKGCGPGCLFLADRNPNVRCKCLEMMEVTATGHTDRKDVEARIKALVKHAATSRESLVKAENTLKTIVTDREKIVPLKGD